MRRLAPLLLGTASVGLVVPLLVGVQSRVLVLFLPVVGAAGVVGLTAFRRTAVAEPGWSGPVRSVDRRPTGNAPSSPSEGKQPPNRSVAVALGRVEARELASSPWLGAGLGLLAVIFLLFAVVYPDDNGVPWADTAELLPLFAHPLVGMVVLATHRAVTRAWRDDTEELFDTCPAGAATRTWGLLSTAWVPVLALVAFTAVLGISLHFRSPNLYGPLGTDALAHLLAAFVLGVGGVVLGVALGRWVRFALAPVIAVGLIAFCSVQLNGIGDPGWNPLSQLSTAPLGGPPPAFADPRVWSHLAWIVALTAATVVAAVARHRRDRTVAFAGVAACVLLAATGVAATRPLSAASADRIAARVADPAGHQACRRIASIQVCVFPGHEELADRLLAEVAPVAAALPPDTPPLTLRQRFTDRLRDLPPRVVSRLPGGVPPVPPDEVALGSDAAPRELRGPRVRASLFVLGLPTVPDPDDRPVVVAGQARGVVALWLATRGLGAGPTRELTTGGINNGTPTEPNAFDDGYVWPESCGTSPVVWSAQDLRAARALVALPDDRVRAVVHDGWERWRDPSTGTDELMAALALPSVGPFDAVRTRPFRPCGGGG